MWYPIDGSALPTAPVAEGNNVPVAIKPEDAPAAAELTNWDQAEKDLDISQTLSLNGPSVLCIMWTQQRQPT
jgi:hypothetical protein